MLCCLLRENCMSAVALHVESSCEVAFLGVVESEALGNDRIGFAGCSNSSEQRSNDELLIELVENAQLRGDLPRDAKNSQIVTVNVSKHGLKITAVSNGNVLDRVAPLSIIQCVSFDDGFHANNVVFLVQKSLNDLMQCYLFQANTPSDADNICKQTKLVFNAALKHI